MIGGAEVKLNTGVQADPRDLLVPEGVKLKKVAEYKIPFEFYDTEKGDLTGLDEKPKLYNAFKDWKYNDWTDLFGIPQKVGTFAGMGISGAGLFQRPRNIIRFLSHPVDYLTGNFERNMLTSTDPAEYAMMDEKWIQTQQVAATALIGGSFIYYARMGAKNIDGSGYTSLWKGPPNPYTGKRSILAGALAGTAIEYVLFLMGGSLVSQYRLNRHDGDDPVWAYLKAISPYGWGETLYGDGRSFLGYIYADYLASTVHMFWNRYTSRAAGALGALLYARFGSSNLAPAMELVESLRRMELRGNQAAYATADASLSSIPEKRGQIRAQLERGRITREAADDAFKALDKQEADLTETRGKCRQAVTEAQNRVDEMDRLLGRPRETLLVGPEGVARLQNEIYEMNGQKSIVEKRLAEVERNLQKDPDNKVLKDQKGTLEKRIKDMDDYVAHLEELKTSTKKPLLDELDARDRALRSQLNDVERGLSDLEERAFLDDVQTARRGELEARQKQLEAERAQIEREITEIDEAIVDMDGHVSRHARPMDATDVRALERQARLRRLHDSNGSRQVLYGENEKGFALDRIEEGRNQRLIFTPEEEAALAGKGTLRRFGSGVASGFRGGRAIARGFDYGSKIAWGYGPGVLEYHFIWDKSWYEAATSALSMFMTLIPNQPWIAGLKAVGVQKIPNVIEYIPSATLVNTVWPLVKWDDDVGEQQCKELRANLLHSQNPRARETVRENFEMWAGVVQESGSEEEREAFSKFISEGGCKLPDAPPMPAGQAAQEEAVKEQPPQVEEQQPEQPKEERIIIKF